VNTINFLETLPTWSNTALIIMYDDSDGWYDHPIGPIMNTSTGHGGCSDGTQCLWHGRQFASRS
jgi:phospholipase C